ncbi:MAG: hypothetical protein ACKOEC_22815, partial [Acidimicrobiia bacterium]
TDTPKATFYGPRVLSEHTKVRIENYLKDIRRIALKADVRKVLDSIERQYREKGWLSIRQIDVLRRCCRRSTAPNPGGGFPQGPAFGRNAPAGRGSGPIG